MKYYIFLCLSLLTFSVSAQKFEIKGKIVDEEEGFPLESATVFVERISDSTLVSYTISDREGNFTIEGSESSDSLRLAASYAGYSPLNRIVVLKTRTIDLGRVGMAVATNELDEVTVVSNRAPVTVKSDTLEFNAGSFNTRQDANLEDVMKKLPGVEVDSQGNITVNGKPVSRILVNGKEFFGDDPKIATKNLPKEIIDKIQVVDTKTKSEEFTGKAGDPDDKTINITIQKDKNKGYFARATAGGGTDERYELSGIGNYFKDDMRISVLASSNNINSSGFSFDEVYDMMGRNARSISFNSRSGGFSINGNSFGGAGGITKSETAGFNYTNEWDEKYELNSNYFFGRNDTETREVVERENFLPEGSYFQNSVASGNLINDSHRANLSFEVEIDTMTRISVRPAVTINDGFSTRSRATETLDENRELSNSSSTLDNEKLHNTSFNNRIDFIRKFGSRGAYLQLEFRNQNDKNETENNFFSERISFANGEISDIELRDQFIDEDNQTDNYEAGITQRSVLAEKLFLDLSYEFSTEKSSNIREVYDFNEDRGGYTDYNDSLSNAFQVRSIKHIPNVGINHEGQKWRTGLSAGLLNTSMENENLIENTSFERNYNNLFLRANMRYEIKRGTSIYAYYNSDVQIPSVRQLQPVPDVTDPLNIIIGNPELDPTYSHRINLGYQNFDFATRSGFNLYASATFNEDQVVPYSVVENLVRTTTYRNLDGGYNAYAGSFYSKRYKKENSEFNYRLGTSANYSKEVGFLNTVRYNSNRFNVTPSIRLGYNYNELVEINPRYELGYVYSDYDIMEDRTEEYINHTFGLEATTYWPKNVVFGNDISFSRFGNVSPGFDPTSLLWNMSLGYQFFNDDATLKVKVYDLLNENVSTSRRTGQDFVEDREELILEQYFMLSFTYKLSKFGGKDPNRGRGGIIRM